MNKKDYYRIINIVKDLALESVELSKCVRTEETFNNLTINELRAIIEKAKKVQRDQDLFLQVDLYHLIGMGDLTPKQVELLVELTKIIGMTRKFIKPIASYKLLPTPKIPDETNYSSKLLKMTLYG